MSLSPVILLDTWVSMFGMRVRIGLAEKGVKYEYREEDLSSKSPLLLEMNPIHKKIPVLVHHGRPVCESLVILHYIDEAWPHAPSLLPSDPYERARARFWADFVDQKVYSTGRRTWADPDPNNKAAAVREFVDTMKVLEAELGAKPFFGGDAFGFVDISLIGFSSWFGAYETFGNFSLQAECPTLCAWSRRCLQRKSVSDSLPTPNQVMDFVVALRDKLGITTTPTK